MVRKVILYMESIREFDRGLLRGISRYSYSFGPWIFYWRQPSFIKNSKNVRQKDLQKLKDLGVEGIIARHLEGLDELLSLGLPAVVSSHRQRVIPKVANIVVDNEKAGRMVADHLIERAFRHFGFCDYRDCFWSKETYKGFCERLEKKGFEKPCYYQSPQIAGKCCWGEEKPLLIQWLKSLPKPIGIFACTDERGRDLNEACKNADLRVPEDVAIMGYSNDNFICTLCHPSLSSLVIDTESAGYAAADLLNKMMSKSIQMCQTIVTKPTYVACRASTDIMAVDDSDVAEAICFIRENVRKPIQVEDVVRHLDIGRTLLYKKFRRALGHSISYEIKKARINQIAVMLINSRLSIKQIAFEVRMEPDHLSRYFSSVKGMSPQAYRKLLCCTDSKEG
jgi:LacI family transcriptional regulator